MEFSLRYPPVRGRLHTRYAPVRRSSPEYCYSALPLDLHVLSLPLAFILSQDQTLHCKNCCFYLLDSSSCLTHIYICMPTHAISFFSSVSNNCRLFSTPVFWAKADAKIQPFSEQAKYFFKKNRTVSGTRCQSAATGRKNFRRAPPDSPAKRPRRGPGLAKNGPSGAKKRKTGAKYAQHAME